MYACCQIRSSSRNTRFVGVEDPRFHGPKHGFRIAFPIPQVFEGLPQLNQGTLYPALLRQEQRGWITSKWGISENNRRAKFYSLTRAGRKQLEEEAESWGRMSTMINRVLRTS